MRPAWGDLERPGRAPQVWQRSQHAFHSNVVGPHFEQMCRQWARWHAGPLLAIGEAKWQERVTTSHLTRLEHIRDLLWAKGQPGSESARMFLFSGTGFSDALVKQAAANPSIQLIGLNRLYYGS